MLVIRNKPPCAKMVGRPGFAGGLSNRSRQGLPARPNGLRRRRLEANSSESFDEHQHVVRDRRMVESLGALAHYPGNRCRVEAPKLTLQPFDDRPQACLEIEAAKTVLHGLHPLIQASITRCPSADQNRHAIAKLELRWFQESMRLCVC